MWTSRGGHWEYIHERGTSDLTVCCQDAGSRPPTLPYAPAFSLVAHGTLTLGSFILLHPPLLDDKLASCLTATDQLRQRL